MSVRRIVIKLGTSTLTGGSPHMDQARMLEIVRVIARMRSRGVQTVLVSSGAVAAGREQLEYPELSGNVSSKQMLASAGQVRLIGMWADLFAIYKLQVGQMLLTRADLEDRERYLNARDTLFALLEYGVVPIINENDAVSIAEIKVGDNDNLAALAAVLAEADCLVLLTDQKGLYTADPRLVPDASLIRRVDKIDEQVMALAGGSGTRLGTGGMHTKLEAAQIATSAGIEVIVASGEEPLMIEFLIQGKGDATFFTPAEHPVVARKTWISAATRSRGVLVVDDGAKRALLLKGSSLLPRGIRAVEGNFPRGATLEIQDLEGHSFARGLARYSSGELRLIAGLHSGEIEKVLGFTHGDVAVHRDDLVINVHSEEHP